MMSRRSVLMGAVCSCGAALLPGMSTGQDEAVYICSSIDPGGQLTLAGSGVGRRIALKSTAGVTTFQLTNFGLSATQNRWRDYDGLTPDTGVITLGVHFVNGSRADHAMVERGASAWLVGGLERRLAFRFGVSKETCQIGVLFTTGVNDSLNGRLSQAAARRTHSMRISDRADHIVTHEFGHALTLKHEHQHPDAPIVWNKPQVLADMSGILTPAQVKSNIFDRLSRNLVCATSSGFDKPSIMQYGIPARWTTNGFSSRQSTGISQGDIACLAGVYGA